jgi:hypothetical protein
MFDSLESARERASSLLADDLAATFYICDADDWIRESIYDLSTQQRLDARKDLKAKLVIAVVLAVLVAIFLQTNFPKPSPGSFIAMLGLGIVVGLGFLVVTIGMTPVEAGFAAVILAVLGFLLAPSLREVWEREDRKGKPETAGHRD